MFSTGHILFMLLCAGLISFFVYLCIKKKPPIRKMISVCLGLSLCSEFVKVFSKMVIIPVVEPVIENGVLLYKETGAYAPYLEAEHLPFELCTYQIFFMILALVIRDKTWKRRLYALMYTTCIIGGAMAIVFTSEALELSSVTDYFTSISAYRSFLYHAMLIVLGIYIGVSDECDIRFKDVKWTVLILICLDFVTLYLNSMMATPYYNGDTLVGMGNVVNYFSSYNNPLGIQMTTRLQWFLYLVIRLVLAIILIVLVNLPLYARERCKRNEK